MCHTSFGRGEGIVLTGTSLSYGQNRSQVTGSDTSLPQHLRDVTQGTPESAEKTKTEHQCGCLFTLLISVLCYRTENRILGPQLTDI